MKFTITKREKILILICLFLIIGILISEIVWKPLLGYYNNKVEEYQIVEAEATVFRNQEQRMVNIREMNEMAKQEYLEASGMYPIDRAGNKASDLIVEMGNQSGVKIDSFVVEQLGEDSLIEIFHINVNLVGKINEIDAFLSALSTLDNLFIEYLNLGEKKGESDYYIGEITVGVISTKKVEGYESKEP